MLTDEKFVVIRLAISNDSYAYLRYFRKTEDMSYADCGWGNKKEAERFTLLLAESLLLEHADTRLSHPINNLRLSDCYIEYVRESRISWLLEPLLFWRVPCPRCGSKRVYRRHDEKYCRRCNVWKQ